MICHGIDSVEDRRHEVSKIDKDIVFWIRDLLSKTWYSLGFCYMQVVNQYIFL